ncbi:hypothetical protein CRD60_06455 [Bifidobacterium aemilianum]|uniref:Uncharacterized protein n=1 Tax=Bifidobacterium aemilianum TaxID=2493120 RepID=A0A366K9S8_9BIFI|nr:hypothetical protein CRD60_06455 [Bifidobacterium aemilianum]
MDYRWLIMAYGLWPMAYGLFRDMLFPTERKAGISLGMSKTSWGMKYGCRGEKYRSTNSDEAKKTHGILFADLYL